MRKSTAVIGVALAVGAAAAETQGNFETSADGYIPYYWLNPETPAGDKAEEWRLDSAEAPVVGTGQQLAEGTIGADSLRTLADDLQAGVSPRCPEEERFQYRAMSEPNTQLCLNTADVDTEPDHGRIIFEPVINPASGLLIDVEGSFNQEGTPPAECGIAEDRLTLYGEYLVNQTGSVPSGETVVVAIDLGACGTYQPEPRHGRPPEAM